MSQRNSGYERIARDEYSTPAWVTEALLDGHLRKVNHVWEPAAGSGKMVAALMSLDASIYASDIETGQNFLSADLPSHIDAIITNPPYEYATEFIKTALMMMRERRGLVAMLLRTDFDHAKTRSDLFAEHPAFAKKVVLTKRIKWFEDSKGQPSFNHAWFIWDWKHAGPPTLAYGPVRQREAELQL
jgi:hypothetical protein